MGVGDAPIYTVTSVRYFHPFIVCIIIPYVFQYS